MSCDLGYIIRDHVPAVLQVLTNELREYNMQLRTTKCLNTAVMIMYLMLGARALETTRACDVSKVMSRAPEPVNLVKEIYDSMAARVRSVFYIMITDGWLTKKSGEKQYFPGHVFVLESSPRTNEKANFNMYQSYIGKYDLSSSMSITNGSLAVGSSRALKFVRGIEKMSKTKTWGKPMTRFWSSLTNVDESRFEGFTIGDNIRFCHRRVDTNECVGHLNKLVLSKYTALSRLPEEDLDKIYGDVRLYADPKQALSNRQVLQSFGKLKAAFA